MYTEKMNQNVGFTNSRLVKQQPEDSLSKYRAMVQQDWQLGLPNYLDVNCYPKAQQL